jgi:hypothetical protein
VVLVDAAPELRQHAAGGLSYGDNYMLLI